MKIKNLKGFKEWVFFITIHPNEEIRIPVEGFSDSIHDLEERILMQFQIMDEIDWDSKLDEEATVNNISRDKILKEIIQHQICTRNENVECWEMGIGDIIHSVSKKIDYVGANIPGYKYVAKAATKIATGKASSRLGACTTCGGTRSFSASEANLGRAGYMNSIGRKPADRIPMG